MPAPVAAAIEQASSAACLVRVRGRVRVHSLSPLASVPQDPQRRKLAHHSFYQNVDGFTTLQCSGALLLCGDGDAAQVHVVCSADILAPFLHSTAGVELIADTTITILPSFASSSTVSLSVSPTSSSSSPSPWWLCELTRRDDVDGVQAAIDQLTQQSAEWAVGWAACAASASSSPCRSHSAAALALLRVQRRLPQPRFSSSPSHLSPSSSSSVSAAVTARLRRPSASRLSALTIYPADFPAFPPLVFLPSSALHRGQEVYVIASPYGLLSPAVFHNSVSRGIISNIALSLPPSSLRSALKSSPAPHASFDSTLMTDETTPLSAFPLADVSFPSQLHFPLQSSPACAAVALTAAACSSSSSSTSAASVSLESELPPSPPPSLVLTDARCLAGAEGAPVILVPTSAASAAALLPVPLVGLVTLPLHLSAASSSPVHFNSVITAEAVWRWLQADAASAPHPRFHSLAAVPPSLSPLSPSPVCSVGVDVAAMMDRVEKSVVIARVGASWASALVLTADGHIATNAHLLRPFFAVTTPAAAADSSFTAFTQPPALTSPVSISLSSIPRRWLPATLLFCCQSPWDIAILKIQQPSPLQPLPAPAPSLLSLLPGQPVYAVGHALFFPSSLRYPTVSRGVLCKVVRGRGGEGEPLLLQSDAAVHNGNSGGALLSAAGHWLGMVTSNVMHTALPPAASSAVASAASSSSSIIIPHMNFSIPSRVVLQVLDWVRRRGAGRAVLGLGSEAEREEVEGVWSLSLPAVWEVEMKPRSHKYAAVLEMVRKAEEAQQKQQQEAQTVRAELSAAAAAATRARL